MEVLEVFSAAKKRTFYSCNLCDVKCSKKSDYDRHMITAKHKKRANGSILEVLEGAGGAFLADSAKNTFVCKCQKKYNTHSGLWKHKQKCNTENPISDECIIKKSETPILDNNLVIELLKQNQEFKEQIMELVKKDMGTINNNINNTINNKFNMNFFLNEQCKGALDIMDFVSSLKVQLTDLENTGRVGYVKGISDIFLRGLKELDVYKRPIHCSDLKREVMYVKDKDVWEKDEDKNKIKKVIQNIAHKNFKQINEWVEENPESKDIKTKKHDQYMRIICKCTGGVDNEEDDLFYKKIITNIAKEVQIEK
uniref:C2H2-type domain-containing protein n=1 Tax=viral metagenome TaxID=1070528 RepID=A0A6C0KVP5_9ZZZZ